MLVYLFHYATVTLDLVARGGGGGSGGGGGGFGGSSGGSVSGDSGGGIILAVLMFIGYVPTHFIGSFLKRKLHNPIGLIVMLLVTLCYGTTWIVVGGSSGVFVGILSFFGGPIGYFNLANRAVGKIRANASKDLITAAVQDASWNEQNLDSIVHATFTNYQQDWSTFNFARMQTYVSPRYAEHMRLILLAIQQRGRRNAVESARLLEAYPTAVEDFKDNNDDRVTYSIFAQADDKLIETVDGHETQLFEDTSPFTEYWSFVRSGDKWLLDSIAQATQNNSLVQSSIRSFATANSMYFNPDWGWLLLPRRGQLFAGGTFGVSDINNHVIGVYKNLIVELYTYIPNPAKSNHSYVIAQVALPKRYDSLIVEAKDRYFSLFRRIPKGYNELSLEWPDFNRRYRVFATNVEQVTAFELLHPVYMEKLFALPFTVSIEVVDNVVYLYTRDPKADYATMFNILKDAFEEMKM